MQPPYDPPREELAAGVVEALIRDASAVETGFGCELTDLTFGVVEDISADVAGGSVSRSSFDTLHGSAQLSITRDLPFGYAVLRPYFTLYDGTTRARFNLGAYFTDTPSRPLAETPVTYDIACYDLLVALDNNLGDAFSLPAGTNYLDAVEDILQGQGFHQYLIDRSSSAVLPAARAWPFDDNTTWLLVVNDLLASIGYQGIWSDWQGRLRVQPYSSPRVRSAEWTYDTEPDTSLISTERSEWHDYFKAPNSWVFVRSNQIDGAQPVDGDGVYRFDNTRVGVTSQEARRRTIVRKVMVDAADQASLEATAQRTIDADMQVPVKITAKTAPNPLHWHFDILHLQDDARGPATNVLGTSWTLPLDGSDMSHEWTVLSS